MTATRYPPATYRPVRNFSGTMIQPTRGLIPHVQVGHGSLFHWFDNPASRVSAHLWISKNGTIEQYVPLDRKAWAQAAGNPHWISVECEGLDSEDYTPTQVKLLGELYAWGMDEFGWPDQITDSPNGHGIGTHRMGAGPWGGHSCPGNIRANRRPDILAVAVGLQGPQPRPDEHPHFANMPTLREGSRGSEVVTLQNALNAVFSAEISAGHLPGLAADGAYGTLTLSRVASLQRFASPWFGPIDDDGVCGPDTWRKIDHILAGMRQPVPA
ncbi:MULTISPECIES: peptidoglycan recognition protein family protein [Pseudofrankia]|uniref:peptidoglycan recognition protein family protein n=1 Tax=Pseudofrankia TaxID=2994363 RepID=UPI000234C5CD|nr:MULTISPECIES: N-acetylmuramoyl-L-alanine amidase [Pseudofrankia]OHV34372.1 peptidoglycan-binding protein [Pseudofrankia sp. EUN1h]